MAVEAVASLAHSILADPTVACRDIRAHAVPIITRPGAAGTVVGVACGASSLPVNIDDGVWVWVPARDLLTSADAATVAAAHAAAAWVKRDLSSSTVASGARRRPFALAVADLLGCGCLASSAARHFGSIKSFNALRRAYSALSFVRTDGNL